MKTNVLTSAFNRGILSPLALARTDVKRVALSAETQTNWIPRTLGSMMLRPGLEYIDVTDSDGLFYAIHIPFVFSNTDTAIIEMTNGGMRVRVDEDIITYPSISTTITNGTFHTDLTGWTDADESGAVSTWVSDGIIYGYMNLVGTGFKSAIRKQTVTVAPADQNIEHALFLIVGNLYINTKAPRGKVTIRIGSADGLDDYIHEMVLSPGQHMLSFTPAGNIYIQLSNIEPYAAAVYNCIIQNGTVNRELALFTNYSSSDLDNIRWDQSGDVLFLACDGQIQHKIERRGTRSWSFVEYLPVDGPFRVPNITSTTLTPSALTGDTTLTASKPLFRSSHIGALFRITSIGQLIATSFTGDGQYSDPIRVTGVGAQRNFGIVIYDTWVGTLTLQRSVGEVGSWLDVTNYTVNTSTSYTDSLDNQIVYYRIGIKTGNYTSGTASINLGYSSGGLTGVARVSAYSSSTVVSIQVLTPLGQTTASSDWSEGEWSDYRGWPTAVGLFEGRLWWAGRDKVWGSVSDAYDSFDDTVEGDSGPISRSIGSGPVDTINWILPLLRLLLGGQGAEHSVRSSSLDEPLTPTNFSIKQPSTQGSSGVAALKMDNTGIFVNKNGNRLFQLAIENAYYSYDYNSKDLTLFCPEIGDEGFIRITIQRMPDTRIHCVRGDGTVAILVIDPLEDVQAWVEYEMSTDYYVVDVFVMPNPDSTEDLVYYTIKYAPAGHVPKYYVSRWALENECIGGTLNKQCDLFATYSGSPTLTLSATRFAAQNVVVWADGVYQGTFLANGSGVVTLTTPVSEAVFGLGYTAQYKSTKLAYAAQGTALLQTKQLTHLGVIMQNTHYQGLKYGKDFDNLRSLPAMERGKPVPVDTIHATYDNQTFEFGGDWDTDSRLCLQATAPKPVTLLAAVLGIETHEEM